MAHNLLYFQTTIYTTARTLDMKTVYISTEKLAFKVN